MLKNVWLFIFVNIFSVSALGFDSVKLSQYIDALNDNKKAMFSLAILKDGEPIYQKSVGFVDIASRQKANKDTQYHIGSITKVFTSTMIFQLIDEGKLSLDSKLAVYYPNVKNADKITISMLLNHRSGIFNFTRSDDYTQYMTEPKTRVEMVRLIEGLDSDFEPGSQGSYSNSAYVLLGFIIEDITKDSYANQLQRRIADKLDLERTSFAGPINVKDNQANSYTLRSQQWEPASETDMSIPFSAGAIISTPTEVGVFLTHLFKGKLLSAASLTKIKEINQGFGRGLFKFPFYQKTAYGHSGGIDGFVSQTGYFDADNTVFTLTANGLDYKLNDISIGVLSIYYGLPFDIPDFTQKPISLPESELAKYQGVFASQDIPLKITIKVENGKLMAQATGQGPFVLTPFSNSEFRFAPAGIAMLFGLDDGSVDYRRFQLKQGGGNYNFTKDK
ncbi:serine hydrolase domain-containing protein [Paraglaciecola aquimarina]|uniref:Serine hydrolase domain-containing protein n=1 Tax=Paraglaciecola aquimarina TaxID=1235557 RepID=A0ABU3SXI6_9ALTE|nr:serine hydrolase domain-containing protein [Paraglaciecola aquimarina]MDU0354714.1 serine hydrolase domain-containing protein [Paraglaciecola aquimarina]